MIFLFYFLIVFVTTESFVLNKTEKVPALTLKENVNQQVNKTNGKVGVFIKNNSTILKTDVLYQMAKSLLQKEKNWLQTEKWLIDNVYRLRNELGDVKRELSEQKKLNTFLSQKTIPSINSDQSKNSVQDLGSLRADHTLIAQQQQQLLQLIKDNQQKNGVQTNSIQQLTNTIQQQLKMMASISQALSSLQQLNESSQLGNTNQLISKLMYDLSALKTTTSTEASNNSKKNSTKRIQRSIDSKFIRLLNRN